MNDRQLLELAAKSAGIELVDIKQRSDNPYSVASGKPWNPLTDDGDALRLAVKLHLILVMTSSDFIVADWYSKHEAIEEPITDDRNSATRRAIVRAAAEVGKGMLTHDEFILMFPGSFDDDTVAAAEIRKSLPPLPEEPK